jgi:hypothetical protein
MYYIMNLLIHICGAECPEYKTVETCQMLGEKRKQVGGMV